MARFALFIYVIAFVLLTSNLVDAQSCRKQFKSVFPPPPGSQAPAVSTSEQAPSSSEAPPPPPATTEQPAHTTSEAPQTPTTTEAPPPAETTQQSTPPSTGNGDIDAYLKGHNDVRAQHGADPLSWSDTLASKAQEWANNCVFEHSGGSLGSFGENLATGTGDSYDIAAAIKSWTDEVKDYVRGAPQASHFTQVVWKATTQVGCAVALCNGIFDASFGQAKFYVCEYDPAGNVVGQFDAQVQA